MLESFPQPKKELQRWGERPRLGLLDRRPAPSLARPCQGDGRCVSTERQSRVALNLRKDADRHMMSVVQSSAQPRHSRYDIHQRALEIDLASSDNRKGRVSD